MANNLPASFPPTTPHRLTLLASVFGALVFAAVFIVIFYAGDAVMLPDPIEPQVGPKPAYDAGKHSQAIAQVLTSTVDTAYNLLFGLFLVAGFAIGKDNLRSTDVKSDKRLLVQIVLLCVFIFNGILSVYFGTKAKFGLLLQFDFDSVNLERLEAALAYQMIFLLASAVSSFSIVGISLLRHR